MGSSVLDIIELERLMTTLRTELEVGFGVSVCRSKEESGLGKKRGQKYHLESQTRQKNRL